MALAITNSKFAQPILGLQEGKILVRAQQYLNFNFFSVLNTPDHISKTLKQVV